MTVNRSVVLGGGRVANCFCQENTVVWFIHKWCRISSSRSDMRSVCTAIGFVFTIYVVIFYTYIKQLTFFWSNLYTLLELAIFVLLKNGLLSCQSLDSDIFEQCYCQGHSFEVGWNSIMLYFCVDPSVCIEFQFWQRWIMMAQIEAKKFGMLANWQREYTMEHILTQLRKEMAAPHNRKLVQPPEGTYF